MNGMIAALGRACNGCDLAQVAGALQVRPLAEGGDLTLLGVLGFVALWTAVETPAEPVRLPFRHALGAFVGWAALLAPLLIVVGAVGILGRGVLVMDWFTAASLAILFTLSGLTAALGYRLLANRGWFERAIVVLGPAPEWAEVGARLGPPNAPLFRIAGIFSLSDQRALTTRAVRQRRIWGAVVADDIAREGDALERRLGRAGIRLFSETEFREHWLRRVDIEGLPAGAIAGCVRDEKQGDRLLGRRGADVVLSLALLFFSLPVCLLVALWIKLDSRGPVIYSQERVGLHGKTFRLLKFRSMRPDAERGCGPRWADPTDSRVTRAGRFLRLVRLDELPQLWNVLRGEMSIIGPRPERPYFVDQFEAMIPCYADRAAVKPGITGWAQVNYRYGASAEDGRIKLAYDLYYVKYRSVLLDLRILFATIRVILLQQGAR